MHFSDEMSPFLNFRNGSPMSSPIKGGSCSAIRRRFNALDYFVVLHLVVRDQEVEGSNPFAPTNSCLSLVYAMFDVSIVSSICVPKWTN
jgi:hypothetical protein